MNKREFTYKLFGIHFTQKVYKKGAYIYRKNETALGIYRVLSGRVKIQKDGPKFRNIIFYFIYPLEFFGVLELFTEVKKRRCDAIAFDKEVIIQFIPFSEFNTYINDNSIELFPFIQLLIDKQRLIWKKYCELQTRDIYNKVFSAVKKLSEERGIVTEKGIVLKGFGQQELADYIGVSRQGVTATMLKLKEQNKIDYDRKQIVIY